MNEPCQNIPVTDGGGKTRISRRGAVLPLLASLPVLIYAYLNPVGGGGGLLDPSLIFPLDGDLPAYVLRFLSIFLLLGLGPLVLALSLGWRPWQLGLGIRPGFLKDPWWYLALVLLALPSWLSWHNPELQTFYPWSKTMAAMARGEPWIFLIHALAYLLCYYIPWEFMFRGIFLAGLLPPDSLDGRFVLGKPGPGTRFYPREILLLSTVQILPSMLLHLPHPFMESLGTIPFGLIAAMMVLRYRSIWPVVVIHATVGIGLDFLLVYGP